ncbi:hypothetical protein C8A01DRAFT_38120 [Parachaetomium inaequale]|uniref:Calcineurin-like phosphoesterase domain-containing protein n=1 Tax=Parachaetomium inaequale TaxID=2588326 RepID=A0AAN6SPW8_9PEZI|nr:hypothetical protein C8A01DRAFT_38120 [Parachaetomium inaequale]
MARPYSSKSSFTYPPRYYPDNSTSLLDDLRALVAQAVRALVRFWRERGRRMAYATVLSLAHRLRQNLTYHRLVSFPHLLVAAWVVVLLWGERWAFHSKVESCHWSNWENWPAGADPHRVALVADPQLIDPHSYPGRPWPLNPLTMLVTDNYLRRSYNQLQWQLDPDSVFFLGDLFDGGREWKTAHGEFKDPEWGPHPKSEQKYLKKWHKTYGEFYWLQEFARFGDIFFNPWVKSVAGQGVGHKRRKLVASLPGNHDLGFGDQIKVPVRNRFETYFGEGNRIDVIGNHTFVSVDTVSMSAASSAEARRHDLKEIYEPVGRFLGGLKKEKQKAVDRELRFLRGEVPEGQFQHKIEHLDKAKFDDKPARDIDAPELPTILLTHVPLHRPPGTPCGPLREKWPPTKPPKGQTDPVLPDHRNAISVSAGYQYQNVLNEKDSEDLIQKVGNVVHAFSGDDHDYCAVTHSPAQAGVPEITVKSISMAMGVSKPGFLLLSLYNPIDPATGKPLPTPTTTTLQTHLCLLPSQLSTYLRYVTLALVSIAILAIRAVLVPVLGLTPFALDPAHPSSVQGGRASGRRSVLLPVFKAKVDDYDEYALPRGFSASHFLNGNNAATRDRSGSGSVPGLVPKGHHGRRKSQGKGSAAGKWGWAGAGRGRARAAPRIEIPSEGEEEEDGYGGGGGYKGGKWKARNSKVRQQPRSVVAVVVREVWTTVWRVVWMVVGFFGWLAWRG